MARGGDERQIETFLADDYASLFASHNRKAFRLALLLCGNSALAEDIVSEAFVKIYPAWQRGDVQSFSAYLRRSVVNQAQMVFRRRRLQRREEALALVEGGTGRSLEDRSADHAALLFALRQLPPKQRAAVVLRYYEDLSEQQTAEVLARRSAQ